MSTWANVSAWSHTRLWESEVDATVRGPATGRPVLGRRDLVLDRRAQGPDRNRRDTHPLNLLLIRHEYSHRVTDLPSPFVYIIHSFPSSHHSPSSGAISRHPREPLQAWKLSSSSTDALFDALDPATAHPSHRCSTSNLICREDFAASRVHFAPPTRLGLRNILELCLLRDTCLRTTLSLSSLPC